ncbi:unnamed protein product [Effrenium voratum]|nr:unnamed protein product [Effrenium voratum]
MARKKYEPPASPVIRPSPPGSPLWPCDDAHKEKFLKDCEDLDAEAFALDPLDEEGSRAGGAEEDDEYDLRFHLAGFEDKAEDSVEATVSEPVKAAAQDGTRLAVPQGRSRSGSGHIIEEHHIEMGESPRLQSALEMVAEAARTRPRRGTM